MQPTARKLEFHKSSQFTGVGLHYVQLGSALTRKAESARDLPSNVETGFPNHGCAKFPRNAPSPPYTN